MGRKQIGRLHLFSRESYYHSHYGWSSEAGSDNKVSAINNADSAWVENITVMEVVVHTLYSILYMWSLMHLTKKKCCRNVIHYVIIIIIIYT